MATNQVITPSDQPTAATVTETKPTQLDNIHSELQAKLKKIDNFKDLLPFIEKTLLLESLKIQISSFLAEQLKKENKQQDTANSIIQSLANELKQIESSKTAKSDTDDIKDQNGQDSRFKKEPPRNQRRRQPYGGPPAWTTSICYNCDQSGHLARDCPLNRNNSSYGNRGNRGRRNRNTKCYHCGNDGHLARDCPDASNEELNEKCFRCGKMGHWSRDCIESRSKNVANDQCNRCGKIGHWAKDCDQEFQPNVKDYDVCNRCGKSGHWARNCDQPDNRSYNQNYNENY